MVKIRTSCGEDQDIMWGRSWPIKDLFCKTANLVLWQPDTVSGGGGGGRCLEGKMEPEMKDGWLNKT